MEEKLLINALKSGESRRQAFSVLVKQYSEQMYWTARHIVGTHENADDVVQNSFIKAWNNIDNFRGDSKLATWLYRIVTNEALDYMRREKKYADDDVLTPEKTRESFADTYFDGDDTERMLREAMETLPEAQRLVFSLKYYEDLPYKEISAITGTSEGGLKANYHYAVEKIKRFFAQQH